MAFEVKPIAWLGYTKSGAFFAHFGDEAGAANGRSMGLNVEAVYHATTLATLQAAILEKDAEIGRLEAERDAWKHAAPEDIKALFSGVLADFASEQAKCKAAEAIVARLQAERDGDVAKAVAEEREACAQTAYDTMAAWGDYGWKCQADGLQEAIRTRPALTGESDG